MAIGEPSLWSLPEISMPADVPAAANVLMFLEIIIPLVAGSLSVGVRMVQPSQHTCLHDLTLAGLIVGSRLYFTFEI